MTNPIETTKCNMITILHQHSKCGHRAGFPVEVLQPFLHPFGTPSCLTWGRFIFMGGISRSLVTPVYLIWHQFMVAHFLRPLCPTLHLFTLMGSIPHPLITPVYPVWCQFMLMGSILQPPVNPVCPT